jgi:glycerate dehydrogenase
MTLTILDAHTANPGDLSWDSIQSLVSSSSVYDRTPADQVIERAKDCELVLTNKTLLSADSIRALPKLRYIGVLATGYNVVDIAAAKERGIVVTNVPGYGTPSVAQAVFALLLELANHVGHHARTVREGRWSACADFCYWDGTLVELESRTLGILGYGPSASGWRRSAWRWACA